MSDQDLLKIKHECNLRYLLPAIGSLLPWIKSGGSLDDVATASINVHAVGIAFKRVGGRITDRLCVRVSVLRKMSVEQLARANGTLIPREIGGVAIDVVEAAPLSITPLSASAQRQSSGASAGDAQAVKKLRPLRAGCSIEFGDVSFGTLGAFCRSTDPRDRGKVFLLSCRHVLAGFETPLVLEPIFQHGHVSGQGHSGISPVAGKAQRMIESEDPEDSPLRYVADAAIAPLKRGIGFDPDNLGVGVRGGILDLLALDAQDALTSERYCKFGRTTGFTVGTLDTVRQDTKVVFDNEARIFDDTYVIRRLPDAEKPMSARGDSGAMMFHEATKKAVGLVIGGPIGQDEGDATFVSPLRPILKKLKIELI